jgi:hypothetical protein
MAEAKTPEGDPVLRELFERFNAQMVSPGGAAALLGLSRKTIHTLGAQGKIRVYRSADDEKGRFGTVHGPKWVFIPLVDLREYAKRVGRPFPEGRNIDLGPPIPEGIFEGDDNEEG